MTELRVKKSFTLMELILVIILISSIYVIVFSNNIFQISKTNKISLENIKEYLLDKNYDNSISLVCINENLKCHIIKDDEISETIIEGLFKTVPDVYEYSKEEKKIEFESINIEDIDYDVFFKLTINSDYKNKEYILDTLDDKVYVFNSLYDKAFVFTNISDVFEDMERKKIEVKDAF